ncbi:hypothetical protein ABIE18_002181 [Arthrobacter sp. 2762]
MAQRLTACICLQADHQFTCARKDIVSAPAFWARESGRPSRLAGRRAASTTAARRLAFSPLPESSSPATTRGNLRHGRPVAGKRQQEKVEEVRGKSRSTPASWPSRLKWPLHCPPSTAPPGSELSHPAYVDGGTTNYCRCLSNRLCARQAAHTTCCPKRNAKWRLPSQRRQTPFTGLLGLAACRQLAHGSHGNQADGWNKRQLDDSGSLPPQVALHERYEVAGSAGGYIHCCDH